MRPGETCSTCEMFHRVYGDGECRALPPLRSKNGESFFPFVDAGWWCGHWEPSEQPTDDTWQHRAEVTALVKKIASGVKLTPEEEARAKELADLYAGDVPKG